MDTTSLKNRMSDKVQEIQPTATTPAESSYLALTNSALDIIRSNLKSHPLSFDLFDVVKSPSGGSTVLSGDKAEKAPYVKSIPSGLGSLQK